jgi:hypothetical protein
MALHQMLKNIPLILKNFLFIKSYLNDKSMTWAGASHEDRLASK